MVIEESGIKFEFPDDSNVVKFDDEKFYRESFNALPGSRGVDFISADGNSVAFIEVKNCLGEEGNNRWRIFPNNRKKETSHTTVDVEGRDSLDIEVPEKVAMTLAALSGAVSFADIRTSVEELGKFADAILTGYLRDDEKRKYVVLVLEGNFGGHTRDKKMIMSELQRSMQTKMRWLNCRVSVVDSDTYEQKMFQIVG